MADRPLRPATHRRLGEPLPHQQTNETRAHLKAGTSEDAPFPVDPLTESAVHSVLARLSASYSELKDRLLTRYSPVRHFTHPEGFSRSTCMC